MKALTALVLVLVFAPVASAATVNVTLDHRSVGVGDPFRYTVEARGDSTLKVIADTGPFAVLAAPNISRSHSGKQTIVRIEQTLACLDRGCAPGAQARSVLLPAAHAVDASGTVTATAAAMTLVPRVPASAVAASRAVYRRQVAVPPPSTPVSPGLAAALLAAAAVLLLALASLLAWGALRSHHALPAPRRPRADSR